MHAKARYTFLLPGLALLTAVVCSGCRHTPSYQSFGAQAIEVNHGSAQAASAVYATHRELNGSAFSDSGRSWTSDEGVDSSIVETTFSLPGGTQCQITRVSLEDRPLLVLLRASDDHSCMELHNVFTRNLVSHGVRPRSR